MNFNSYNNRVFPVTLFIALFCSPLFLLAGNEGVTAVPFAAYMEAECAMVGENWMIVESDTVSNGSYVVVDPGFRSVDTFPEDVPANQVRFVLNVQEMDEFFIWGLVEGQAPDNDSFWVRVNGGDWVRWSRRVGDEDGWAWRQITNSPYTVEAGEMTIDFAYRERNTKLDKILVTTLNLTPSGIDQPAFNCGDQTDCERNPEDCTDQVWIEGECGDLGSEWSYQKDANVSNGGYVVSRLAANTTMPTGTGLPGQITYTTKEISAGTYYLNFRLNARGDDSNSFWVKVDDGEWFNYGTELDDDDSTLLTDGFEWKRVTAEGDSTSFDLEAGSHTIYVARRESGLYLDKIFMSQLDTLPTNFGAYVLGCMENAVTPVRPSLDLSASVKVFPNPVANQLTFSMTTEGNGRVEASIFDFSGRRMQVRAFDKGSRTLTEDMDVSRLPKGVYQLVLTTEQGVVSRNFVKL